MFTLVATVHVIIAVMLILLVLVQDSKGGAGMFSGGSSQSILGATGGATLLTRITRYSAIVFAVTSILLTIYTSRRGMSVFEGAPPPPASTTAPTPNPTAPAQNAPATESAPKK